MKKSELIKKAIDDLKEQQKNLDTECAHIKADNILCDLLKDIGFGEVVIEYEKINKWYD